MNKKNGQSALPSSYAYNIRSWMKSVAFPLFSQIFYYNDTYAGNQLVKTEDRGLVVTLSQSMDFKNNANLAAEYLYYKNGNLIKKYNKNITEISYNVLNLPQTLKISSATNTYTYSADGRKLKTAHTIFT